MSSARPVAAPRARLRRVVALAAATTLAAGLFAPAADAAPRARLVSVRVISFNDLHGNLQPPSGSSGRVVLDDGSTVDAGGAAYMATHLKRLQGEVTNSFVVSTGDSIGASPLPSALFHDEPTVEFLNSVGVKASVVGNHEFDEGFTELKRIQQGGCHPTDGCQFRSSFAGARFPFLGANVTFTNGSPALLPFKVQMSGGVPVGIIGVTLEDLPSVVTASAIEGLKFGDEVQAINRTANLLDRFGVRAQIVLLHQGDASTGGPNACNVRPGIAERIAQAASPKVDAFFTGHSHQQYNCSIPDPDGQARPVIQGLAFGRLLSVMDFKIDRRTKEIDRSLTVARNEIVTRTVTPDPAVSALVDEAVTKSAPIANRPIGAITADLTRAAAPSGETTMGDVIADAQLAATTGAGAQIAITNIGGVRGDLNYAGSPAGEGDGVVTYGEAFTVQPFANILQTITLTGAQLDQALEQQAQTGGERILQISHTLHYTWDRSAAVGSRASNLTVNGVAVTPTATYRVTVNNFLAGGGDNFAAFTQGTNLVGGPIDLDAFTAYLEANAPISPPPLDRITLAG
jgi:5'-nucleotidase